MEDENPMTRKKKIHVVDKELVVEEIRIAKEELVVEEEGHVEGKIHVYKERKRFRGS